MTTQTLYLFPDTNLFIQCKSLNELDWSEWANFSEIHLIVCRPVLREIDNQKNRGNGRVSRRARKAHSLFRDIAINEKDYELIQKDGPKVTLTSGEVSEVARIVGKLAKHVVAEFETL